MKTDFLEKIITIKDIPKECPVDLCLLENNEKQIGQICEFLQSDNNLLLVNGFKGSGKTLIVDYILSYINSGALILHYTCLETTILDDMLLSFFETFRNYTVLGKIVPPKIKVENFTQKIGSYFNTIDRPILIVLDAFDDIIKSNKPEILNFIKHLMKFPNIKLIAVAKVFNYEDFVDVKYSKVTMLPFSQKIFEKYLREHDIKQIGVLSNELYKLSKGYYNYLTLTLNIMNLRQLSLVNFLELFSKSYMGFPEFIIREALSLVDPISAHLFRLLTVMRIPIHINLLKSLNLYDEGRVYFFVSNSILSVDGECLYLKDSFRQVLENQIPENVMIKLHTACIDLYNTQLPLKPLERDLKLSRQTMRNEIEYHSLFIPKKPVINPQAIQPYALPTAHSPIVEQQSEIVPEPAIKQDIPVEISKEEKIKNISFIVEDETILNDIADSIKDFITTTVQDSELEKESSNMTLQQILNTAKQEEQKFNYKRVVMLYQNALTKKNDDNFYTFLPSIYIKLAQAYQKLSDWYDALEYYTQAQDFYYNASNMNKVYEVKLSIANIYYLMYKHDNAKFILSELEKAPDIPNELCIKVKMAIAKLSDDIDLEYKYYKEALPLVEVNTDKLILTELYYKYAAVCDEKDELNEAAKYYKKCIDTDYNPRHNNYLSRALSNLAELYDEAGSTKLSVKYFNESIKIDTVMKNYSGLYNSAIHLAEIFASKDDSKAVEYMNMALEYAKSSKDSFYIVGANLELGDYYFLRRNMEYSYKYFIAAYTAAKNSFAKDNLNKISERIEDVKKRVTEQDFRELQEKYGK